MAQTRESFLAELGLNDEDLAPPQLEELGSAGGVDDSLIRSTPLYDTNLLESLKAEQLVSRGGESSSPPLDGVDLSGNAYLKQELDKFRSRHHTADSQITYSTVSTDKSSIGDPAGEVSPSMISSPDYQQLGYNAQEAKAYRESLMQKYREKKEKGLLTEQPVVVDTQVEEEGKPLEEHPMEAGKAVEDTPTGEITEAEDPPIEVAEDKPAEEHPVEAGGAADRHVEGGDTAVEVKPAEDKTAEELNKEKEKEVAGEVDEKEQEPVEQRESQPTEVT